ncbi:unnamed protein product [Tetraodon nigroviridis]|uniref:(spotted green pufferfish) hypothetical protein n=1 Tax=Tetraodon nigroviridis TaxID=99883 RepID=Q4RM09_TETNG|nr:unnamed protein product [Tetraodon nigroviridis]
MASCSLPRLESGDPRLKLTLQDRVRNVFVTHSDTRHEQEEKVKYTPVVKEKKAELDQVDEQLKWKRDEFKSRMEDLAHRRSELQLKQQQNKETVMRFEKFVADNEAKRSRALKKYEAAQEENVSKQSHIEELTEELERLKVRQQVLKKKIQKHKIYEDYLLKTLDYFPSTYLDHGSRPSVMSIIRRHEALSVTNQELRRRLGHAEQEVDKGSQQLQSMKREHNVKKLMGIKELSELQGEFDSLKEENEQMEDQLATEHGLSREKVWQQVSLGRDRRGDLPVFWNCCHAPSRLRLRSLAGCSWPSTTLQSSVTSLHADLCRT